MSVDPLDPPLKELRDGLLAAAQRLVHTKENTMKSPETIINAERFSVTIYLAGVGPSWTARAYDERDEHIWSSEGATSPTQALREVTQGIERWRHGAQL